MMQGIVGAIDSLNIRVTQLEKLLKDNSIPVELVKEQSETTETEGNKPSKTEIKNDDDTSKEVEQSETTEGIQNEE